MDDVGGGAAGGSVGAAGGTLLEALEGEDAPDKEAEEAAPATQAASGRRRGGDAGRGRGTGRPRRKDLTRRGGSRGRRCSGRRGPCSGVGPPGGGRRRWRRCRSRCPGAQPTPVTSENRARHQGRPAGGAGAPQAGSATLPKSPILDHAGAVIFCDWACGVCVGAVGVLCLILVT